MIKFIEDKVNDDLMYNKTNYLYSFNCRIIMRIGTRGIGKTYDAKCKCLKLWRQKKQKFIWVRATEAACDEMTVDNGAEFFNDLGEEYKDRTLWNIQNRRIHNGKELIGLIIPLSTFYKKKGNAFPDYGLIVFDEVIPEKIERRYFDRMDALMNTCETIGRTRPDIMLLMLANALDKGDEVLTHFGIKIDKFGYYINTERKFICHYERPTLTYQRAHENSLAGLIAKDSEYEANLLNNEFNDRTEFFDVRPKDSKLLYIIHNDYDVGARLYIGCDGILYVCKDFNRMGCGGLRYTNILSQIAPDRQYLSRPMNEQLVKA